MSQFPDRMRNGVDNGAPVSAAAEREMTSDTTCLISPRSTLGLNPWVARCVPLAQPTTLAKHCAADQRGANGAATAGA